MEINGVWVGWGLGDNSRVDLKVQKFKAFARRMYKSYMGHLADTNIFDQQLYDALCKMQDKLVDAKQLAIGNFIRGVLDLETQYASGFIKRPDPILPLIFTVEGHMSDMFFGPSARTAETLEQQGVCKWRPTGYNCTALPFDNRSGIEELVIRVNTQVFDDGVRFPPGTPWGIIGFSQGAMIISAFMRDEVINPNGRCHWRLKDFKRGLAQGNPRRAKDAICAWAINPPLPGTSGIMDDDFVTAGTPIEGRWAENAHRGDMFADNPPDQAGEYQTAIAKIITENSWFGGQAAIFAQVLAMLGNVPASMINVVKAIISAILFLAKNPNPHYSTVAEPGDIKWMRGVKNG